MTAQQLPPLPGTVPDQPPADPQVFDPGNPYIMDVPAMLVTDLVTGPNGQRFALTVRVPNTTVTVLLAKDDAIRWRDQLSAKLAEMNGLIL